MKSVFVDKKCFISFSNVSKKERNADIVDLKI